MGKLEPTGQPPVIVSKDPESGFDCGSGAELGPVFIQNRAVLSSWIFFHTDFDFWK